jgi:hypothetical protein
VKSSKLKDLRYLPEEVNYETDLSEDF